MPRYSINYTYAFIAASTIIEPQSYEEAKSSKQANKWQKAMETEYNSPIDNNTRMLVQ